jgi:hypothetical protein
MPLRRPGLKQLYLFPQALWPVAMALGLAACTDPRELAPGAIADSGGRAVPWEAQVSARSDEVRRLSEGEGEIVVANAVAAHEKRRP